MQVQVLSNAPLDEEKGALHPETRIFSINIIDYKKETNKQKHTKKKKSNIFVIKQEQTFLSRNPVTGQG